MMFISLEPGKWKLKKIIKLLKTKPSQGAENWELSLIAVVN